MIILSRHLICILSVVLVSAIAIEVAGSLRSPTRIASRQTLADILPREIKGWNVRDQPIASTEEMKRAVGELLNYDDAVFRSYSRSEMEIDVYVAYWHQGKIAARLVGGHTPDVCWEGDGWRRVATLNGGFEIDGQALYPGRARCFEANGARRYVVFWHFDHGQLYRYSNYTFPPWWAMFCDLKEDGLNLRAEQYFIRISSTMSLEESFRSDAVHQVVSALGPLVLYRRNVTSSKIQRTRYWEVGKVHNWPTEPEMEISTSEKGGRHL